MWCRYETASQFVTHVCLTFLYIYRCSILQQQYQYYKNKISLAIPIWNPTVYLFKSFYSCNGPTIVLLLTQSRHGNYSFSSQGRVGPVKTSWRSFYSCPARELNSRHPACKVKVRRRYQAHRCRTLPVGIPIGIRQLQNIKHNYNISLQYMYIKEDA